MRERMRECATELRTHLTVSWANLSHGEAVEQYKKKKIHLDVWKLQRVKIRMNESLSRASDGLISLKRRLSSLDAAN